MESQAESKVSTTLSESIPVTNIDPRASIEIELLQTQPLKNEEIVELISFICQSEAIGPFIEHVITLRDRYDMTIEIRPLEIEILSLREKFNLRILRNFYIAIGDVGYHGLVPQVITMYQWDPAAAVYLLNLEKAFGIQPDEDFVKDTIRVIENSDMDGPGINAALHLFQGKLQRISKYAPIPKYIKDFDIIVNKLPRLQPADISDDATPDIVAQYIQERLENMGQYLEVPEGESAEELLIKMVKNLNSAQYEELVDKMSIDPEDVRNIQNNRDIFRVYGPVNPYPDTDFSELLDEEGEVDVNLIFGGARMFTDLSQEIDSETSAPLDEWFVGYCMQCDKRIRTYHHAVREPGLLGGWSGCFCNWDCVRGSIRDGQSGYDFEGDITDPSKVNIYALQLALTVQMENNMNDIKIADRDYEEVETNEEYLTEEEGEDIMRRDQLNEDFVEKLKANIALINIGQENPSIPIVQLPYSS